MPEIQILGRLFTAFSVSDKRSIYKDLADKFSAAIKDTVITNIERSNQLLSMVGERPDQDAIRAIYRGIKVNVRDIEAMSLEIKFDDNYKHLYSNQELPDDVVKILQDIIDKAINNWFRSPEPGNIINEVLGS